jgi:hypothetical protein
MFRFNKTDVSIGESVNATTPEMMTAPAREKANSLKSVPVTPVSSPIGA